MQTPGHSFSLFFFLGGGGGRLEDEEDGLLSSTLLVMQHLPFPGHLTDRSISSQRRAKKPVTQVPLHLLPLFLGGGFGGFGFLVVVVVVRGLGVVLLLLLLLLLLGMMSCGGGLLPKSCLATQHLRSDLQRPPMSRMASQKPDSLSATHTPGQVSEFGRRRRRREKQRNFETRFEMYFFLTLHTVH